MPTTLVVSGEPRWAPFRFFWISIVAQTIASWGFLLSAILPFMKKQCAPPPSVETVASRYQRLTPRPTTPVLQTAPAPLPEPKPSTEGLGFFASAARNARRRFSVPIGKFGSKKTKTSTRPRSASDPTSNRGSFQPRAQRCMNIASNVAAKSTAPARPIVKRARSVIRRSFYYADPENEEDEDGSAVVTLKFFQAAGARTKDAFNRSATAATTALATASHKVTPTMKKGTNVGVCGTEEEKEAASLETTDTPTDTKSARTCRTRIRSRRFSLPESSQVFARLRS